MEPGQESTGLRFYSSIHWGVKRGNSSVLGLQLSGVSGTCWTEQAAGMMREHVLREQSKDRMDRDLV